MGKLYFALYLIALALCSTITYRYFQSEWISFRAAEKAYKQSNYAQAFPYYLKALEQGINPKYVVNRLSVCATSDLDYEKVNRLFEKIICQEKDCDKLIISLSSYYIKTHQVQTGISLFEKILENVPWNHTIRLTFARFLSANHLFDDAIAQYQILYTQIPFSYDLQLEYAQTLAFGKKYDLAITQYKRIIEKKSHLYSAKIALANCYLQEKNYSDALYTLTDIPPSKIDTSTKVLIAYLYRWLGNFSEAEKRLSELIKKYPKQDGIRLHYATILSLEKKYSEALSQYELLLKKYPDDFQLIRKYGLTLLLNKQYNEAEKALAKTLDLPKTQNTRSIVPKNQWISDANARLTYARLLKKEGTKQKEALREYLLVVDEKPDDLQIRCELVTLYHSLKMYDEASQELYFIKSQWPTQACLVEAGIYLSQKQYKKAIETILSVPEAYSSSDKTVLQLAIAYEKSKQTKQALNTYLHLLKRQKKPDHSLYEKIGDLYLLLKKTKEAVSYFKQAVDKKPRSRSLQKKYALALFWAKEDARAVTFLLAYYKKYPKDRQVAIELARLYRNEKNYLKAQEILKELQTHYPHDPNIEVELITLSLYQGHAKEVKRQYHSLLQRYQNEKLLLDYASAMNLWGDFYQAEAIFREYLEKRPQDEKVQLLLAKLLISTERYYEAEKLYKKLLSDSNAARIYLDLANLEIRAKNLPIAFEYVQKSLEEDPSSSFALLLLAQIHIHQKKYKEAEKILNKLLTNDNVQIQAYLELGKLALLEEKKILAMSSFQQVLLLDSENVDAKFYLNHLISGFLDEKTFLACSSATDLRRFAELYLEDTNSEKAIAFYLASLKKDVHYFPSQIGLDQLYGSIHQYAKAINSIDHLLDYFPEDYKLLLWKARILAWAKNYEQSVNIYKRLHQLNPLDPIPLKEMARTLFWAKKRKEGINTYREILHPSVDEKIRKESKKNPKLKKLILALSKKRTLSTKEPFSLYEQLQKEDNPELQKILLDYLDIYKQQKAIYFEVQAKENLWNKRFLHADDRLKELVAFELGNEEALFDLAQVKCTFGMCFDSKKEYEKLLELDPMHSLAKIAYDQNIIRSHPLISLNHNYWAEQGRGQLDRIYRNHTFLTMAFPYYCQNLFSLSGNFWNEKPNFSSQNIVRNSETLAHSYRAYGFSLSFLGRPSRFITIGTDLTQKYYENNTFTATTTGYGRVFVNANDAFTLGGGYDYYDELDNYFTLRQRTQAGELWGSIASDLGHKGELLAKFRRLSFSDSNKMQYHDLKLTAILTDHPHLLKFGALGEYRDTKFLNIYVFEGTELIDIIYPYWTPQKYYAWKIFAEWRHDLSKHYICGHLLHYYDFRISTGSDTEKNRMITIEGIWHNEFLPHWSFDIRVSIFQSSLWNARAAWATLQYQF